MTGESKRPISSGERWDEGKRRKRGEQIFWITCEQLVMWVETYVDLMLQHPHPPRPPSSSHRGSLHVYQKTPSTLQLMEDKPSRPDLARTRLLFIPSLPVPTPPLRPGFSWQALISLPNRLQTWGFAIPHRASHGIWPSFESEHGGYWLQPWHKRSHFQVERTHSECHPAFSFCDFPNLMRWGEGVHAAEGRLRSCHIKLKC